ncbi:peripherin-2-like [Anthonomus grandis grandis]|uniref:peripherin-2-like n=1 Tax=Anthonomus grandis grandis TaxID=2921223 RepID=UPI0021666BE1|nr:peripherin-2-like [Anthonomus grandis grandis]XP_050300081.1 peripherin-2-like [Anthonomus grandis grandis]
MSPVKSNGVKDGKSSAKNKTPKKELKSRNNTPNAKPKLKSEKGDKPVSTQVTYKRIKLFSMIFTIVAAILIILSLHLLWTSINIRSRFGSYLNMISSGEGEILPTLLAIPVVISLILDITIIVFVYKLFADKREPLANKIIFYLVLGTLAVMVLTLVTIFATLGHVFGSSKHVEDGIRVAMSKYAVSSYHKKQIDRLQIEFQCCGSTKYDDWYNISWSDQAMSSTDSMPSKTPFSCCKIKSKFPCIHYAIDCIGTSYLYVPEFNLSVSATGCHAKIIKKKRKIGMTIVGYLILFICLEVLMLVPVRFLQTAHSTDYKFDDAAKTYTVWLIGSNPNGPASTPLLKKDEKGGKTSHSKESGKAPPPVPPVPPELRE